MVLKPTHHQQQNIHQGNTSFRANGASSMQSIPHSYFVGGTNFAYVSKLGTKVENTENSRVVSNNQNQVKQRIIYGIATDVKLDFICPKKVLTLIHFLDKCIG